VKKKRLLQDFTYLYDEVIVLGMTRYEFGLWLLLGICYGLRKAMT
jgi:hypothetical protein